MKYELAIAARYLWMARRRAHTAFLTIISTLGLAVGVATLLISLALLSGLQGKIKARLFAASPQLLIEPAGGNAIPDADKVMALLRREPAARVDSVISGTGWASTPGGERGRPIRIGSYERGKEPAEDVAFGKRWSVDAAPGVATIYLRRDFANAVGLFLGDDVIVVAPRVRLTPFGPVPVWKRYRITRIVTMTDDERAPEAYLSFDEASRLLGTGGAPNSIVVYTNAEAASRLNDAVRTAFPELLIRTWEELNRPLFLALRLEKVVMFVTISLIIFVAALNLISSISMLIVEKRPHVGILRTLGASERSVLAIFLGVGFLIGLIGTALGNLIGLGVSWAADRYHLIPIPGDVSLFRAIPFLIEPAEVIAVNVIAVLLTVLATWYPAVTASKLDPIAALREV